MSDWTANSYYPYEWPTDQNQLFKCSLDDQTHQQSQLTVNLSQMAYGDGDQYSKESSLIRDCTDGQCNLTQAEEKLLQMQTQLIANERRHLLKQKTYISQFEILQSNYALLQDSIQQKNAEIRSLRQALGQLKQQQSLSKDSSNEASLIQGLLSTAKKAIRWIDQLNSHHTANNINVSSIQLQLSLQMNSSRTHIQRQIAKAENTLSQTARRTVCKSLQFQEIGKQNRPPTQINKLFNQSQHTAMKNRNCQATSITQTNEDASGLYHMLHIQALSIEEMMQALDAERCFR